jgi:signal transduction histidine kinase/CheY-like chemotaxis protein
MHRSSSTSIRARLVLLVFVSVTLAQLIGLGLSIFQEISRYATSKRDTLISTAEVLASAAAQATAERNSDAAHQAIRAIGRIEGMTFAAINTADGLSLAAVGATEQLAGDLVIDDPRNELKLPALLRSQSVEVSVPVIYAGEEVGKLRLMTDTRELPRLIWGAIGTTGAGAAIALVMALGLALNLQSSITRPLRALTTAMERMKRHHDYSVVMPARVNDEIGLLVDGFNAMIVDIKERDDRLLRHRDRLERDVAERTDDFRRAAAEADLANQAKSDFLATMSHEIRTPMNGILVMAELLATTELPRKARRQAEVIVRSGESLLAIINDILDLSKIEAGKLEVEKLDVDVTRSVDTVLQLFADRAASKGLDFSSIIDLPQGGAVLADPVRLGQVLGNLVNNALKFTAAGGVSVNVGPDGADPAYVRFRVIDTGIGIPAEKLSTIFEAFSQADRSTTRQFGGTGLGLAIARQLVTAMGGELAVESTVDVGTVFSFALPMAQSLPVSQDRPLWRQIPETAEAPTAVVCLAGPHTTEATAFYLTKAGFRVRQCQPAELVQAAERALLVIAGPDALAVSLRLRTQPQGVVALLGQSDKNAQEAMTAGLADISLSWPLSRDDLEEVIVCLREGRAVRDMPRQTSEFDARLGKFGGLRVLVADDSDVNREVALAALNKLGITPDLVNDGKKAVEACLTTRYDLVFMDGSMPLLDGFDASRLIRSREQDEGRQRTPIVALTAHVVGSGADAWRTAGMDGVLHKPFTLAQMSNCIASHIVEHPDHAQAMTSQAVADLSLDVSLLDQAVITELRHMTAGSPEIITRIIKLYCDQSSDRVDELLDAVRAHDLDKLARAAHALKSMSYNIGARGIAETAAEFEHSARIEKRNLSVETVDRLAHQLSAVRIELNRQTG